MSVINILDKKVYSQIAAGEVVERPSSVIKELVENSVDAGATKIKINIFGGGIDVIEVSDNGSGIFKDDLLKAIMPHATSKILDVNDIQSIKTLGFRGEALSSIASVSKLKITTKTKGLELGYSLEVDGGENPVIYDAPSNEGTFVTVRNLFYNVPARQKFFKSVKSEENDVTDIVTRLILSHPNIAFTYSINDKVEIETFGDGIDDAINSVYGNNFINECFKISNYLHGVKIEGYISKINYSRANRTYQSVILNGRFIQNQTISSAIANAYSSYLMKRRYPAVVLYITIPAEIVDVNVTPNKTDVRFIDNSVIYGAIYSTISKVLDGSDSALNIVMPQERFFKSPETVRKEEQEKKNNEKDVILITTPGNNKPNTSLYKLDKPNVDYFSKFYIVAEDEEISSTSAQNSRAPEDDIFAQNKKYIEELERKKEIKQEEIVEEAKLKYIGQVLNCYLVFEYGREMVLVDQHAAHERLLYNKLLYYRTTKEIAVQPLLVPYELNVNAIERNCILEKLNYFKDLGFEIESSVNGNFMVYQIPLELIDIDLDSFFNDVLCDYSFRRETIPEVVNEKIMQKACKSAVKAGMQLSNSEVESLVILLNGNINLKCPHGRPIAVKISKNEIDKWFKRVL